MPREDVHLIHGYPRKGYHHASITAEEAVGVGILTVILGILLLLGCWYCRRRSGYQTLKDKSLHAGARSPLTGRYPHEESAHQDSKLLFQEHNCGPVVKDSSLWLGASTDKVFQVPNAPPSYEKLSAEQSPPPYSP
ncbi:melanoma antigen recognized by T-cells 1 isoform X2 [Elephas maximus indicus]|nr:melanoma antigen recognized by T-cells 1 isoform X2 [Elephas maximus indicus]XP_049752747.1 melanoma antigen recognized by T-cells 1 isoform X2 [Elephas maximus indicus]XP_049752748.1 melanoma antigen recognized by T-cells 1 isoform X2 [Elephas maximus indicus]